MLELSQLPQGTYTSMRQVKHGFGVGDPRNVEVRTCGRELQMAQCRRFKAIDIQNGMVIERWMFAFAHQSQSEPMMFHPIAIKPITYSYARPMMVFSQAVRRFISGDTDNPMRALLPISIAECWMRCEKFIVLRYGAPPYNEELRQALYELCLYGITPMIQSAIETSAYIMEESDDPYTVAENFEESMSSGGIAEFKTEFGSIETIDMLNRLQVSRPYLAEELRLLQAPSFGLQRPLLTSSLGLSELRSERSAAEPSGQAILIPSAASHCASSHDLRKLLDIATMSVWPRWSMVYDPTKLPGMPFSPCQWILPTFWAPGCYVDSLERTRASAYGTPHSLQELMTTHATDIFVACLSVVTGLMAHFGGDHVVSIRIERDMDEYLRIAIQLNHRPTVYVAFDLFLHVLLSDVLVTPPSWFINLETTTG